MHRPALLLLALLAPLACAPLGPALGDPEATTSGEPGTTETDDTTATTGEPTSSTATPTSTTATTDGPETTDTGDTCETLFVPIIPATANVMLVLDKSGSMASASSGFWDHDGDDADDDGIVDADPPTPATPRITRWASLHAGVESLLTDFATRTRFGAVLFPSAAATAEYSAAACPVSPTPEVPVGFTNADAILAGIPEADATKLPGGSPTAAAINTALTALADRPDVQPPAIVLVTDGPANCAADAPDNHTRFETLDPQLAILVAQALADGVPTFVVGIAIADLVSSDMKDGNPDGINTHDELDELAVLGGRPQVGDEKFFNAHTEAELIAALANIGEQLLPPCISAFGGAPVTLLKEVRVGPARYEQPVTDCTTEDGWRFTDATQTAIELCGQACDDFREQGGDLVFAPC